MGWLHRDDESKHEGFVVAVLPGGIDAPRDSWEDSEKADGGWAWSAKYNGTNGRPRAEGIRATCYCGWQGSRTRADFTDPEAAEEVLRRQWFHHVELSMARTIPARIQSLIDELEEAVLGMTAPASSPENLDEARPLAAINTASVVRDLAQRWQETAVRTAKADYTWEAVALALGTSKQSAHERFRNSL
ncbi:hypothetical protein JHN49_31030 [Streptomyces sp. MBT57]|nr:hypothetical protein [Streptomyces sp. MBT57]